MPQKQRPLAISILGTMPPIPAISAYCMAFANALASIMDIEFISFNHIYPAFLYPGGALSKDDTFPDISFQNLTIRRNLNWYNPLSWLLEGLSSKTRLLHAQWWSFPLLPIYLIIFACFKAKKKPIVITVHNVLPHEANSAYIFLTRLLYCFCDYFIVHTSTNANLLSAIYHIHPDKISIIPHGPLDIYLSGTLSREQIRKQMGIKNSDKAILLFGSIRSYKGTTTALHAFSQLREKIPDAKLIIAGKLWEDWTPYKEVIQNLKIESHVITALDYIPTNQVARFFIASDLVVLPYTHFESQSGVGLTAVNFHKPMIVSDVGGLPDLVKDKKYIVRPHDEKALALAMETALLNDQNLQDMADQSKLIASAFSWTNIAKQTMLVYYKALKNSPKPRFMNDRQ